MSDSSSNAAAVRRTPRVVLLGTACLALLALFVWQISRTYWLCDDAYISFRYARNFIEGKGLVFNPGEKVEGYTNFLWVLELSGLWKLLGLRPETGCSLLSSLYTAGTIFLTVALALGTPFRERHVFAALGALLLLAASHTFAVWSTSGLETRQFTFFLLLAIVCVRSRRAGTSRLLLASVALAAAEYTRPEANLLFVCFLGWLGFESWRSGKVRVRELLAFAAPFALLVGCHLLWRWNYYGDLWPNTYYAKHVRAWPEAGIRYLEAASIEFGLYALVPAAVLGTIARARRGDATHLLAFACILPHAAYVTWIGGDHFEYRVFDFYWPLLAVAAVDGVLALVPRAESGLRAIASLALLAGLVACTSGVQVAKEISFQGLATRVETHKLSPRITRERFPVLHAIPGVSWMLDVYMRTSRYLAEHGIAAPQIEHRVFWLGQVADYAPYEALHGQGWIPGDAVTLRDSIGVSSFYLADLVVIDTNGLTDRHVAHQPVDTANEYRYMAHERSADWPYLESRGLNVLVHPAARSAEAALDLANYAMRVRDDLWMPFDALLPGWAEKAFASGPTVRTWSVAQDLGCFSDGTLSGWTVEGAAFEENPRPDHARRRRMHPYRRCPSRMLLDSRSPGGPGARTGTARSPVFRPPPGASLEFVLGGTTAHVGARLLEGDRVLAEWTPTDPTGAIPVRHPLRGMEGKLLQLCVFDESGEEGGFVLAGEAVLLVPVEMKRP